MSVGRVAQESGNLQLTRLLSHLGLSSYVVAYLPASILSTVSYTSPYATKTRNIPTNMSNAKPKRESQALDQWHASPACGWSCPCLETYPYSSALLLFDQRIFPPPLIWPHSISLPLMDDNLPRLQPSRSSTPSPPVP